MHTAKPGYDKLIFELSSPGRHAHSLPECDVPVSDPAQLLPEEHLRAAPAELPEVSEVDVVRHYSRLSQMNYGVDTHFYPLGSCTMKYNPKINEDMARLAGFARLHPLTPEAAAQGALRLMDELSRDLGEVSGMDHVSLQPAFAPDAFHLFPLRDLGVEEGIGLLLRLEHRIRADSAANDAEGDQSLLIATTPSPQPSPPKPGARELILSDALTVR